MEKKSSFKQSNTIKQKPSKKSTPPSSMPEIDGFGTSKFVLWDLIESSRELTELLIKNRR